MNNEDYNILNAVVRKINGIKVSLYALETALENGDQPADLNAAIGLYGDELKDIVSEINGLLEQNN